MAADRPLQASPFAQFQDWMAEAEKCEPNDSNAMAVATATPNGCPSVRTVLLKGVDDRGFVFYTNKESRKGDEHADRCRRPIVAIQQIVEDGSEMPLIENDSATEYEEIRQAQNAEEQAEQAHAAH